MSDTQAPTDNPFPEFPIGCSVRVKFDIKRNPLGQWWAGKTGRVVGYTNEGLRVWLEGQPYNHTFMKPEDLERGDYEHIWLKPDQRAIVVNKDARVTVHDD